jgi:PhoH-like ATPase
VALAGALKAVFDEGKYKKIHVIRPIVTVGKDIGYLPGSMTEKMEPFTAPIIDNLNFLIGKDMNTLEDYLRQRTIEVEAMPYIRGRSLANAILIVDEAQNLSKHEAKTLITRVGEGTKIIFTGDLQQIDTIHLNEISNGLTKAVEEFKYYDIAGHVTLKKGERSALATLAARIMR